MPRLLDRPLPDFVATHPTMLNAWPHGVHLVIEQQSGLQSWDTVGVTWDTEGVLWDQFAFPGDFRDVACHVSGVDIEHGPINSFGLFPAGNMTATLIDPDGRYSRYNNDGTLVSWQIGKRIGIVLDDGDPDSAHTGWTWLYYGRITRWSQVNENTVEIESFNAPNEMTSVGKFTAGANGDLPNARLTAIRSKVPSADILTRFDTGTVALTAQETPRSPWEEMQVVMLSDGGLLFPDVDDAMVYRDRNWMEGRSDQPRIWYFADNICGDPGVDITVWDAVLTTSDETVRTEVRLTNVAGLNSHAEFVVNPYAFSQVLTHSQPDQWTFQEEGDILARVLHNRYSVDHASLETFQLYVHDSVQNLWPIAIDTRINDRFVFMHTYPNPGGPRGRFQLGAVVTLIRHSISASQWVMTIGSFSYTLPLATVATAQGHFVSPTGQPARIPHTRSELDHIVSENPVMSGGQHVTLGDGTEWFHDASACDGDAGWSDEFDFGILDPAWTTGLYTVGAGPSEEHLVLGLADPTSGAILTPRYTVTSLPRPVVSMLRPGSGAGQTIEVEIEATLWDQNTDTPTFYAWWLELYSMADPATGARRYASLIYNHSTSHELTLHVGSYNESGGITTGTAAFLPWPTGSNMTVRLDVYPDGREVLWINGNPVIDATEATTITYGSQQGLMSQWTSSDAGGISPRILRSEGGPIAGWVDEFTGGISPAWIIGPYTSPAGALQENPILGLATGEAILTPRYVHTSTPYPIVSMIRPGFDGAQTIECEIDAGIWDQNTGEPMLYSWWLELSCFVDPATGARRNGSLIYDDDPDGLTLWVGSYNEDSSVTAGTYSSLPFPVGENMRVRFDAFPDGRMVYRINDEVMIDTVEVTGIVYGSYQGLMSQWTSGDAGGDSPIIIRAEGGSVGGPGTCWQPGRAP